LRSGLALTAFSNSAKVRFRIPDRQLAAHHQSKSLQLVNMMTTKISSRWMSVLSLASVLVVSACGGGSDNNGASSSGSGGALTTVTEANHTSVAANGYAGSAAVIQAPIEASNLVSGVAIDVPTVGAPRTVIDLLMLSVAGSSNLVSGVSMSESCPGGGNMLIDATVQNTSTLNAGDSLNVQLNNCVLNGVQTNGKLAISVKDASGMTSGSGAFSLKLGVQYQGFSSATAAYSRTIDGDMLVTFQNDTSGKESFVVSGNTLTASESGNGRPTVQRTLSGYSATIGITAQGVASTLDGRLSGQTSAAGTFNVNVKTLQPFVSTAAASQPTSGAMQVSGAASAVTLTVLDASNVKLDYNAKGDGAVTKSTTLSWADLLKAI
jgi:hypothetical protein